VSIHSPIDIATARPLDRHHDSLLKLPEVMRRTSLSRMSIYRRQAAGTFPRSVSTGANSVAWYESDIGRWVANPLGWQAAA
jgi:prophage regulatory protein